MPTDFSKIKTEKKSIFILLRVQYFLIMEKMTVH